MIIGSGKTLAYLAPLISRLRDEEEHEGLIPRLKRPRALILLPSRDLAAQVLAVAKSLCHVARFRAVGLIGGIKRVRKERKANDDNYCFGFLDLLQFEVHPLGLVIMLHS